MKKGIKFEIKYTFTVCAIVHRDVYGKLAELLWQHIRSYKFDIKAIMHVHSRWFFLQIPPTSLPANYLGTPRYDIDGTLEFVLVLPSHCFLFQRISHDKNAMIIMENSGETSTSIESYS